MPESAGSVVITIGGDTTAFEAALARARQSATAFDATITAQLSGAGVSEGLAKIAAGVDQTNALLAKLTTTGTAAGAALTKVAASTTATTAALTQVATATKLVNAEMASIGGSGGGAAALAAGTISAKDFAAALEATGGNLSKITPQMVGLAVANEEVAVSSKAAAVGMAELGVAETEAAGLGAGVTREFMVLGSEVARGNVSRIPGSMIVLGERLASVGSEVLTVSNGMKALGLLGSTIFNPFVLGFLAISFGAEAAVKAFKSIGGSVEDVNTVLENHKKLVDEITGAYPEAAAAAKKYEEIAKQLPQSVVASDAADRIKADQASLDKSLGGIVNTLRLAQASSDAVGTAGAEAFGHIADEIEAGSLHAADLSRNLVSLSINPALNDTAQGIAQNLKGAAIEALGLENVLAADKGLKSVGPDGQKAQQTLFDVSAGFKDVKTSAGNADATIAKLFGTMNSGGGSGFGVTRSLGTQLSGQLQTTLGMFQQVDAAVQNSRQNQLAGMMELEAQYRATTARVEELKTALSTAGSKEDIQQFFGDVSNIKNANDEIGNATKKVAELFAEMAAGSKNVSVVDQELQSVRQTLISDGFPVAKVDAFIERLRQVNQELVTDQGQVHQLGAAVNALHDRTITITVQTRQVGTGTQSTYDVPGGPVSVTRYGGTGSPGFTQQSYQVPSEGGYGSQGGSGTGTGTVNVTRFATGGMYHPGDTQQVSFFKSPDETVAIFTPQQRNALANPQSGFTGTQPTTEDNRYWTVLMNIEAATQKTAQLLDDIKTMGAVSNSGSGGSSYGSSSGSQAYDSNGLNAAGHTAQQIAVYNEVLKSYMANYAAIGGGGIIGYGSSGLAATPQQIAANIAYGGASPLGGVSGGGSTGSNGYQYLHAGDPVNASLNGLVPGTSQYAQAYAQALAKSNAMKGFATGGIDSSDTQKVEFFKNPNEKVIIATPQQFADVRPGSSGSSGGVGDQRPISLTIPITIQAGANVSKDSLAAMRTQIAAAGRDMLRSINGR